jgi:hypothetical protein
VSGAGLYIDLCSPNLAAKKSKSGMALNLIVNFFKLMSQVLASRAESFSNFRLKCCEKITIGPLIIRDFLPPVLFAQLYARTACVRMYFTVSKFHCEMSLR